MRQVRVALLGLGTVGTGVWKMIQSNQDVIARRTGRLVTVEAILVRDLTKDRQIEGVQPLLTSSFEEILEREIDVVIEVMGGVEPTRTYLKRAMEKGCHIVSANKELLARHGEELREYAKRAGVEMSYEASVGGGIPVIGAITHFLKANRIYKISGILNGTTNFILTKMKNEGRTYEDVLAEAQELGYAEADPTADVEGIDAAHKLSILSRLSFDACVDVDEIQRKGITDVSPVELSLAHQLGFTVKLLASAEQFGENGPVACCVYPTLLPLTHPLASVNGVYNAIHIEGDFMQDLTFIGQGAGEKPTASAVVEDLCNLERVTGSSHAKGVRCPLLDGVSEGGLRFYLLKLPALKEPVAKMIEQLMKLGVPVYTWEAKQEESVTWLAFIARGLEKEKRNEVFAKLGWQMRSLITRPVMGGDALFATEAVPLVKAAGGVN